MSRTTIHVGLEELELLGLAVFGATFTTRPGSAIFSIAIALSGLAAAPVVSAPSR